MTTRSDVLEWIRCQTSEEDLGQLKRWIALREGELTRVLPWAKQIRPGALVHVKGAPAPTRLHGRIGTVIRETKNPMKLAVDFGGGDGVVVLHSAALDYAGGRDG